MTRHSRIVGLAAIAIPAALMLGSCGAPSNSIVENSSDATDVSPAASPEPSELSAAVSPDSSSPQESDLVAKASIETADPVLASATAAYPSQPLTSEELTLMASELGPSEEIIEAHSFALALPELGGNVAFVASQAGDLGDPRRLNLRFRTSDGEYQPLVPVNQALTAWNFYQLNAVAFEDINNDGLGPDIVAIADYMTGAGPQAAQPFPVATVHFKDARGFFAADEVTEVLLSEQGAATIAEVRSALSR